MPWKEILVRVSDEPDWRPAADTAAGLAARFGAHLAGLAVIHMPERRDALVRRGLGEDYLDQRRRDLEEETRKLGDEFRRHCERPGVAVEWRVGDGDLVKVVATQARYADLLVLGPSAPVEIVALDGRHLVAPVVLASGRPVLFIPAGAAPAVGRHVAVAWNGSREAARAAADALPLLAAAAQVSVLIVRPKAVGGGAPPGAEVAHHLALHGAKVQIVPIDEEGDAGGLLLRRCAAVGADLLVMGAYGHSRLRELVLGGATSSVLHRTRLPLLMSH